MLNAMKKEYERSVAQPMNDPISIGIAGFFMLFGVAATIGWAESTGKVAARLAGSAVGAIKK